MGCDFPLEDELKLRKRVRILSKGMEKMSQRVKTLENADPVVVEQKATTALQDIRSLIAGKEGSGANGNWTLNDCSEVIKGIANKIAAALGCLAACLVFSGCVSEAPLRAVGPHGYIQLGDMDPSEEVMTAPEVLGYVDGVASGKMDFWSSVPYTVTPSATAGNKITSNIPITFNTAGVGLPDYAKLAAFTVRTRPNDNKPTPGACFARIVDQANPSVVLGESRVVNVDAFETDFTFVFDTPVLLRTGKTYQLGFVKTGTSSWASFGYSIDVSGTSPNLYAGGSQSWRPIVSVRALYPMEMVINSEIYTINMRLQALENQTLSRINVDSFKDIKANGVSITEYIADVVTDLSGNTKVMTVANGEGGYTHEFYLLEESDYSDYETPLALGNPNTDELEASVEGQPRISYASSKPQNQTKN